MRSSSGAHQPESGTCQRTRRGAACRRDSDANTPVRSGLRHAQWVQDADADLAMPSLAASSSAPAPPRLLSISTVAAAARTSPSVLRIWERRYAWPRPERRADGTRGYTQEQADDLVRLVRLVRHGHRIRDLLEAGYPRWPGTLAPKPLRTAWSFDRIPQPTTPAGHAVRRHLEAALHHDDAGAIAWAVAEAVRLHPADRERAVYALLAVTGRSVPTRVPVMDAPPPHASPAARPPGDPIMSTTPTPVADPPTAQPDAPTAPDPATNAASAAPGRFDLIAALRAKMAAERLSIRTAAKAMGIQHPLLWQVLAGRVLPSAAKAPHFATWLGVDVAILPRASQRQIMPPSPPPTTKPSGRATQPSRRTRRTRPVQPERPTRVAPAMVNRPLEEVLAAVRTALLPPVPTVTPPVHPIVRDQLAMRVYAAPAALRKVIAALLTVSGRGGGQRPNGRSRRR